MYSVIHSSLTTDESYSLYVKESAIVFLTRQNNSYESTPAIVAESGATINSYNASIQEKHLRYLYREGVLIKKINVSFYQYKIDVLNETGDRRNYYNFIDNVVAGYGVGPWYESRGVGYRQKQKYQKKSGHAKKVLSEIQLNQINWRINKEFLRSRNKDKNWRCGLKSRSISEKASSRSFRQMEKRMIKKGKWDDLADSNSLSRGFRDPWDWD
jgi:hypothetical protein